jgi:hypothetical protein
MGGGPREGMRDCPGTAGGPVRPPPQPAPADPRRAARPHLPAQHQPAEPGVPPTGRSRMQEQRRIDIETFGGAGGAYRRHFHGGRGRGRGGGRGRGRGGGGGGGGGGGRA